MGKNLIVFFETTNYQTINVTARRNFSIGHLRESRDFQQIRQRTGVVVSGSLAAGKEETQLHKDSTRCEMFVPSFLLHLHTHILRFCNCLSWLFHACMYG
jgi:hypothetical protein